MLKKEPLPPTVRTDQLVEVLAASQFSKAQIDVIIRNAAGQLPPKYDDHGGIRDSQFD